MSKKKYIEKLEREVGDLRRYVCEMEPSCVNCFYRSQPARNEPCASCKQSHSGWKHRSNIPVKSRTRGWLY